MKITRSTNIYSNVQGWQYRIVHVYVLGCNSVVIWYTWEQLIIFFFLIIRWYHSLIWIICWCLWMLFAIKSCNCVLKFATLWLSFIFLINFFLYWNYPKMLHLFHCSKCGWFLQTLKVHDCGVCDVENAMLGLFSASGYVCDFWAQQIWWLRCLCTVIHGIVWKSGASKHKLNSVLYLVNSTIVSL